jgi:hypothetical protein
MPAKSVLTPLVAAVPVVAPAPEMAETPLMPDKPEIALIGAVIQITSPG